MKRRKIQTIAATEARRVVDEARTMGGVYHVLSIRFAGGRGIDVPFDPWKPRQTLDLPGRWDVPE